MRGQTFIPMDYEVFAGLDVDKRSIAVTFTTHQGFLKSLCIPYSVEHLLNPRAHALSRAEGGLCLRGGTHGLWLV
jgi:hypothetical protein